MQTFFVQIKCALGRTYDVASALAEASHRLLALVSAFRVEGGDRAQAQTREMPVSGPTLEMPVSGSTREMPVSGPTSEMPATRPLLAGS